jgi:hypothetical protein
MGRYSTQQGDYVEIPSMAEIKRLSREEHPRSSAGETQSRPIYAIAEDITQD